MTGQDSSDWLGLSGRVCVVTGGGGGIGRAVAVKSRAGRRPCRRHRSRRTRPGGDARGAARTWPRPCRDALRYVERRERYRRLRDDRESAGIHAASWSTPRRCCGPAGSKPVAGRMERGAVRQPDRLFPLRADFRPADAQARARQSRSCGVDRRQPRPGPERRLQRQQGRRHHAVASARERMGTAGHPQQCRQPRHGRSRR